MSPENLRWAQSLIKSVCGPVGSNQWSGLWLASAATASGLSDLHLTRPCQRPFASCGLRYVRSMPAL
eukprot:523316-Amphidinium_carterae.1